MKEIADEINRMHSKYKNELTMFKTYLNKLMQSEPMKNGHLVRQHQKYIINLINSSPNDVNQETYKNAVKEVIDNDSGWNVIKEVFPSLNYDMIDELYYHFDNNNEDDFKEYIRKLLIYPGNYTPLFEFENYMDNYRTYFTKQYNAISDVRNAEIEKLITIISSTLSE
jgi:hypothetical protein